MRYARLPFGLKTSGKICQRLMDRILKGSGKYAACLVDDVTVYSNSFEDHMRHLDDVLTRIEDAGLQY